VVLVFCAGASINDSLDRVCDVLFQRPVHLSVGVFQCSLCRKYPHVWSAFRVGIEDDSGADGLMMAALDKVEKSIGKTLLKDDANGLAVWKKELDQVNQK